jgi:DNA-binding MarR family transcriptional regulator
MPGARASKRPVDTSGKGYVLDDQVGFILRQVSQRHGAIFAALIGDDLTATQWAALAKLHEKGPCSQNLLGRQTAMDVATIKGVVDRLAKRGLVATEPDPKDGRRLLVALTDAGRAAVERLAPAALEITRKTLAPLDEAERAELVRLLRKLR